MSVAFRRESDEDHREPRPDLPIPPGPNMVTPRGLALIAEQAEAFEAELDTALAAGADEDAVKAIRRNLRYWHARRATAQVAPMPDGGTVAFGTRVDYVRDGGTDMQSVMLVGDDEADPATGRIAFGSPLARALMGLSVGDVAPFRAGGGMRELEIVAIAVIDTDDAKVSPASAA